MSILQYVPLDEPLYSEGLTNNPEEEMARFASGWIKINRNDLERIGAKPHVIATWIQLCAWATIAETRGRNGEVYPKGTCLFSLEELRVKLGATRMQVRIALKQLKNMLMINIQTTRQGTRVTIINHYELQKDEDDNESQEDIATAHQQQTNNKQTAHQQQLIKNKNKNENENKNKPPLPPHQELMNEKEDTNSPLGEGVPQLRCGGGVQGGSPLFNGTQSPGGDLARESFDLESIYRKYPRKLGKAAGLKRLKVQIKTRKDFDDVLLALENYTTYCKTNCSEPAYIKHFSTWVNSWRDWLDADVGKSLIKTKTQEAEERKRESTLRFLAGGKF